MENVGLVIWGCKGGYKPSFCDNGVVDVMETEIKQALKDIRSFIAISQPGVDFYAIEFTSRYKVFTQYRSSNDSGSGAFTAITVFVPHKMRIVGLRPILNQIMDAYFSEYMNPISGAPLQGKYDDISNFVGILRQHQSSLMADKRREYHEPSRQDDIPQLVIYDSVDAVEKYFDSPYRPEFFACQEVMFLSREVYEHGDKYALNFLIPQIVITKISEPKPESSISQFPDIHDKRLTKFVVNGEDLTETVKMESVALCKADQIEICIECDYHHPLTYSGLVSSVQYGLIRSVGSNFAFASDFTMTPIQYFIRFRNNNASVKESELAPQLYLVPEGGSANVFALQKNGDEYGFSLSGREVTKRYTLCLSYLLRYSKDNSVRLMDVVPVNIVKANSYIECSVKKETLKFSCREDQPDGFTLNVTVSGKIIGVVYPTYKKEVTLLLPESEPYSAQNVTVKSEGYDCILRSDGVFEFTPTFKNYELNVSDIIKNCIKAKSGVIRVSDSFSTPILCDGRKFTFKLPYGLDADSAQVTLSMDGRLFVLKKSGRTSFCFKCVAVLNNSSRSVSYNYSISDTISQINASDSISSKGMALYAEGTSITLSESSGSNATLIVREHDKYVRLFEMVDSPKIPKPVPYRSADTKKETPSDTGRKTEADKPKQVKVTLINCQKWFMEVKSGNGYIRKQVGKKEQKFSVNRDFFKLYDTKGIEEVYSLNFNNQYESTAYYESKGFFLEYSAVDDTRYYTIEYRPSLLEKIVDVVKNIKFILAVVAVLLVIGGGCFAYFKFFRSSDERLYVVLQPQNGVSISEIKDINDDFMTVEDDATIVINNSKFDKDKCNGVIVFDDECKLDLKELVDNQIYPAVMSDIKNKVDKDTISIAVFSPGQTALAEARNNENLTIGSCVSYAERFPHYVENFAELAAKIVRNNDYDEKSQTDFMKSPDFKQSNAGKSLVVEIDNKQFYRKLSDMLKQLDELNCSINTVKEIEAFMNEKNVGSQEDRNRVKAYRDFFEEKPIYKSNLHYYSKKQQFLIKKIYWKEPPLFTKRNFVECDAYFIGSGGNYDL